MKISGIFEKIDQAKRRLTMFDIAKEFGTPVYVYEGKKIVEAHQKLRESIRAEFLYGILYAMKANSNPEILKILLCDQIEGIDAVSPAEIALALKVGFSPDQIIFTGNNLTDEEMAFAMEKKIWLNIDSLSCLKKVGKKYPGSRIWLRINSSIGAGHHGHCITGGPESKFGIWHTEAETAKRIAKRHNLKIIGLHQHIGSQILKVGIFLKAVNALLEVAVNFPDLEYLDFGGGLGVPYRPEENPLNVKRLGREILKSFKNFCGSRKRRLSLILEPGRYLVAESGYLLAQVNTVKKNPNGRIFVGVNTGFNHLIRPAMYGSYHEIINISNPRDKKEIADIVGNLCESGDKFATQREINHVREGDLLVIENAGAYGYSMSSNYNLRPKPAEVLVEPDGKIRLIRPRENI